MNVAQLVECVPNMQEAWVPAPAQETTQNLKPGMVALACNLSTQEVETGGSVHSHP